MKRNRTHDDASGSGAPPWGSTGFPSTGFGPTAFGAAGGAAEAALKAGSVFDVCHVGVVLRALLLVHAALAIGVMFGSGGGRDWFMRFAAGSVPAVPAVLMWLVLACALRRRLGALRLPGQWLAAAALGVACGLFGALVAWLPNPQPIGEGRWLACALAGAALASVMFQWLHLRARATLPAETAARLAELQSRIRPHFLFNSLNTALTLVRIDPTRAEDLLEDLAELFRVALSEAGTSVTLADEIELARRYLAIEQIRFGGRLRVVWEIDEEAGGARVPPLLLQPLVENAVRHGVEPADAGGDVRVRTRAKLGHALISIVNTVPEGASRPGHGMALHNVRERLRLMHDVAAQFETRQDEGMFRVKIVVPL